MATPAAGSLGREGKRVVKLTTTIIAAPDGDEINCNRECFGARPSLGFGSSLPPVCRPEHVTIVTALSSELASLF